MKYLRSGRQLRVAAIIMSLALPGLAAASSGPDTSANAMINGGCTTRATCVTKLQQGDGVNTAHNLQALYAARGITVASISSSETIQGTVTKSGEVIVLKNEPNLHLAAGQVVATNAQSFGRSFIQGSTRVGSLFERPTSVSFVTNQLPALIHVSNGRFQWAMVESCGNIVVATPKIAPAPVKPVAQVPAPAAVVNNVTVTQVVAPIQIQNQAPAPAVAAAAPTPTPAPAAQPAAATTPLPQTGASALGMAGLSVLLVVAGYYRRSRRSLRLALRRV